MEGLETRAGISSSYVREPDGRKVNGRKVYDVKALWDLHHQIIELHMEGYKGVKIAEMLAIHPQTVSNILNSTLGNMKLEDLRAIRDGDLVFRMQQIHDLTDLAMEVYREGMENENGQATFKERKEIADTVVLELSGLRVPTKVQSEELHVYMDAEKLAKFKERARQSMIEAGMTAPASEEGQ